MGEGREQECYLEDRPSTRLTSLCRNHLHRVNGPHGGNCGVVYSALTTVSCPGLRGEQRRVLPVEWTFAGDHQSKVEGNMLFLINIFGSDSFFGPSAKAYTFLTS